MTSLTFLSQAIAANLVLSNFRVSISEFAAPSFGPRRSLPARFRPFRLIQGQGRPRPLLLREVSLRRLAFVLLLAATGFGGTYSWLASQRAPAAAPEESGTFRLLTAEALAADSLRAEATQALSPAELRRLSSWAAEAQGTEKLARQARRELAIGRLEAADRLLEQALEQEPQNWQLWNDRALVRLARGGSGHPSLSVQALEAAEQAVELAPGEKGALATRAAVREALGLGSMFRPAPFGLEQLEAPGADLAELVAASPQTARRLGEEQLLPRWADAELAGRKQEAAVSLELASRLGRALAAFRGDALLRDSAAVLATARGPALARLARAHQGLARARKSFPACSPEDVEALGRAESELEKERSPFAGWARFYRAACTDLAGRPDLARAEFEALAASLGPGTPSLAARCHWALGLWHSRRAEISLAQRYYPLAAAGFEALGEMGHWGVLQYLQAENVFDLGRREEGWRLLLAALAQFGPETEARQAANELTTAARVAREEGLPHAAAAFLESAEALPSPADWSLEVRFEVSRQKLLTLAELGRLTEATAENVELLQLVEGATGLPYRSRLVAEQALAEAELCKSEEPKRALALLDRAQQALALEGNRTRALALAVNRSRLFGAEGRSAEQERALSRALATLERQRGWLEDLAARGDFLRTWRSLYRELAAFLVDAGRPEEALAALERGRARELLELRRGGPGKRGPAPSPEALAAALPAGTTVVVYAELPPQRLVAWRLAAGRVELRPLPLSPADVAELSERVAATLREGRSLEEVRQDLAELYQGLIAPVSEAEGAKGLEGETLRLSPDAALAAVPWPALFDPLSGQYLVDRFTLHLSPSATLAVEAARKEAESRAWEPPRSALLVAAPEADPFWQLLELPGAAQEVGALRGLVPGAGLLAGPGATVEAVEAGLRGAELLHLAAHAEPAREGEDAALYLSGGSERGRWRESRIAGLPLGPLRLVVLAACSSARGELGSGEGLGGLPRAFLLAGAEQVLATVTDLPDTTARPLFEQFYQGLARGERPAQALRQAQRRFAHPEESQQLPRPPPWWIFVLWDA
ncbi:MAG: CHAT domain-containing protein [Thermoanaerobaculia bacterium]